MNILYHLSITHRSKPPTQPFTTPFLDWSVSDIYTFFLSHVRPLGSELSGAWPAHTFLILDVRTPADKTYLLCSDMLDFSKKTMVLKNLGSELDLAMAEVLVARDGLAAHEGGGGEGAERGADEAFDSSAAAQPERREVNGWMANPVAPGNRKAEEGREDGAASEGSVKEEPKRDGEED
ncbi:hypothetical protein MMC08_007644 [Hypocenomyce scalaris]|nr:hypothetical protein [Hypocenomyce scalaris]